MPILKTRLNDSGGILKNTRTYEMYETPTLYASIQEYNRKCPREGGLINREHIGQYTATHLVYRIWVENNNLCADIEFLDNNSVTELMHYIDDDLELLTIRPIISTPLHFGSGVVSRILEIKRIDIEVI